MVTASLSVGYDVRYVLCRVSIVARALRALSNVQPRRPVSETESPVPYTVVEAREYRVGSAPHG